MHEVEHSIISGLLRNPEFTAKTISSIKPYHFSELISRNLFESIYEHYNQYGKSPTPDELKLSISAHNDTEETKLEKLEYIEPAGDISTDVLLDTAEKHCKHHGIMNAMMQSIQLAEEQHNIETIPNLLADAVSFTFNLDVGLSYFDDIDERFDDYNTKDQKFRFSIDQLNKYTGGGYSPGTLNIGSAPTGFGKSIWLMNESMYAAANGKLVIYYTFEMSDFRMARRADSKYFQKSSDDIKNESLSLKDKFREQRNNISGDIIIKEYAPDSMTASGLASHIKQTEMKHGRKVDLVVIDYINLMRGSRANVATHEKIEDIAKEIIRHIAKDFKIPVLSATQLTRGGQSSDTESLGVEHIAQSQGLVNTVDFMFVMQDNTILEQAGWAKFKIIKNRYGINNRTFLVGLDRALMTFYDVDQEISDKLVENAPNKKDEEQIQSNIVKPAAFNNFSF